MVGSPRPTGRIVMLCLQSQPILCPVASAETMPCHNRSPPAAIPGLCRGLNGGILEQLQHICCIAQRPRGSRLRGCRVAIRQPCAGQHLPSLHGAFTISSHGEGGGGPCVPAAGTHMLRRKICSLAFTPAFKERFSHGSRTTACGKIVLHGRLFL